MLSPSRKQRDTRNLLCFLCFPPDVSEGDSLSVYSSNSAGNILDDDARSFTSFRSSASASTMQSNHMSSLSVPGVRSSAKDDIFVSWQNSKLTYGLSKNRLPPQVREHC